MIDENNIESKNQDSNTDLAFERTMLAYERTLLAWLRTSISLITFGFAVYKFFGQGGLTENTTNRILSPRAVGMIMISLGMLSLFLGQLQQQKALKKLKKNYPDAPKSYSSIISFLVLVFGVLMFLGALLRQ